MNLVGSSLGCCTIKYYIFLMLESFPLNEFLVSRKIRINKDIDVDVSPSSLLLVCSYFFVLVFEAAGTYDCLTPQLRTFLATILLYVLLVMVHC